MSPEPPRRLPAYGRQVRDNLSASGSSAVTRYPLAPARTAKKLAFEQEVDPKLIFA
jgi:hypothetical protein